ncbi:hypothetical protein PHLGIDRAFT_182780 [Phlebiopsis gigantea 11061_1 CR5-6]|uniref:B30.2/SPRY domain-containing protein n=1 Tax=Phlebiopsis gigantea (strain 11061_1 CR5-6) TaxID=745531 RepID=A0A0C3NIK2_PHLG1|nr:hypothetical protein PHLGIDRAFT_182780 [Phlebiopsis gigantea 11061_1 CR5-6]
MLYFEVKITFLPGGEDNIISLGACLVDLPPEQLYPNTAVLYNGVAYESTGRIMYSSASCRGIWDPPPLDPFFCRAAAFQEGDIIGCGFTEKGMQLFFTKNGRCIWESIPCIQYVPPWVIPKPIIVLGLGNALQNDACGVQVNFGRTPFMFNIEAYTEPIKQAIAKWRQAAASLPPELIHHIIIHTLPPLDSLFDHNALVLRTELVLCQSALSSVSNVCRRWWLTLRRVRFALVSISTVKRLQYFTRMASCTLSTANRNPLFISPGPYVKVLELFGEAAQRIYMLLFSDTTRNEHAA